MVLGRSVGVSSWVTWLSRLRALVVLFLVGVAPPLLATGCRGEPAPSGNPAAAEALRSSFPEQAAGILHASDALVASESGFAAASPADPADAEARRGGLSAALPRRGEEPVRFHLPGRLDISVREAGASGEGALAEGAVAYTGVARTSFWSATNDGYEEWIHVAAGVATDKKPVATWEIEGATLRDANGSVQIADAAGAARLHVTAPLAIAAGGRPVPTRLAVHGSTIELWLAEIDGEEVLVDPTWSAVPPLSGGRVYHTATLLNNGKVLVVGGMNSSGSPITTVEAYDPASNTWSPAHALSYARHSHTATLLANGKVLVAGGYGSSGNELHAELYDPGQDSWSAAGTLASPGRYGHVAALVANGRVLIAGGYASGYLASAERWDPGTNAWTSAGSMPNSARYGHTGTLLTSNGKVLVTGGYNTADGYLNTAVLYTPGTNSWALSTHTMAFKRTNHATVLLQNNLALVSGGYGGSGTTYSYLITAETYDPVTDAFTSTALMSGTTGRHTATLQPDGKVLVVAGINFNGAYHGVTQQYDPAAGTWTTLPAVLITSRAYHTATLLQDGKVLVAAGYNGSYLQSAELFDPVANTWAPATAMSVNRWTHTATLLSTGKVWVAGGYNAVLLYLSSTAAYDPGTGFWSNQAAISARAQHTATLLQSNQVLVAGGTNGSALLTAAVYDPPSNTYVSGVGSMHDARYAHTATLLQDGTTLVAGGYNNGSLATAETYNPSTKAWTTVGQLTTARSYHTATLLQNGTVLVTGGYNAGPVQTAEVYSPATQSWATVGALHTARYRHTATLLPDGKVLIAGGYNASSLASAEIYDPVSQAFTWSTIPSLTTSRYDQTATALTNGWVLLAGGYNSSTGALASAEIYDPAANAWLAAAAMKDARYRHTATRLQDGTVLVTGGYGLSSAEIYTPVVPNDGNPCTVDAWSPGAGQVTHIAAPAGTVCRAAAGPCDVAETCDGTSLNCPADGFRPSGYVCRAAAGACDAAETCNGTGVTCPSDAKLPSSTVCRASNGACDAAESCDGTTNNCPADSVAPNGSSCDDGNGCTQGDTCQSGVCTSGTLSCSAPNATGSCVNNACVLTCAAGFANCDGVFSNGCEVNLYTDAAHCGSCATACPAATACANAGICDNQVCKVTPFKIEDGNPCTADACDPVSGMSHTALANGTPCWDGSATATCQSGSCSGTVAVTAPTLYANPRFQSPVRGDHGDLLLLAGTGFQPGTVVVYKSVSDTTQSQTPPAMPGNQTASLGVIDGNVYPNLWRGDNALEVKLPSVLTDGQAYALWAATPDPNNPGQWLYSNSVLINDARPMWVSPGPRITSPGATTYPYVYSSADRPGTLRTIKIAGRNLQPMTGYSTQVRFTTSGQSPSCSPSACQAAGGQCQSSRCVVTLAAAATNVARYAAQVDVPAPMPLVNGASTDYDMAVSRDNGVSWVPVPGKLTVLPDPAAPHVFRPNDYGDLPGEGPIVCDPCAAVDHTLCISRAIHDAAKWVTPLVPVSCSSNQDCAANQICKGNGLCGNVAANVVFDRGTCGTGVWFVNSNAPYGSPLTDDYFHRAAHGGEPNASYVVDYAFYGIQVPKGVNLVADASGQPTIKTGSAFDQPPFTYWAGVNGANWEPGDGRQYLFELLGDNVVSGIRFTDAYQSPFPGPGSLSLLPAGHDIAVTGNFFDGPWVGVGGRGEVTPTLPDGLKGFSGLVVQGNTFGIWSTGVGPGIVEDSVTSDNVFWPGGGASPIAGGWLGARRLDVSSNTIDGDVNTYSEPSGVYGWRAGFFFPTFTSQEDVLVADNTLNCIGTRAGQDGEAISTDSNGGPSLLRWTEEVQTATSNLGTNPTTSQIVIGWPASSYWTTPAEANNFVGYWVRVSYGAGLGQARKITAVSTTATKATFTVSPAFDVLPVAGSRIGIGSQVWQMDIASNEVNNTCPNIPRAPVDKYAQLLAGTGNNAIHFGASGLIGLYSTSVDVAMDSNVQTETAGLEVYVQYWDTQTTAADGVHGITYETPQYFIDVRGNHLTRAMGGLNNANNTFGSGIALYGVSTTLLDNVPQENPNLPGFGVSVSHNVLTDVAMKYPQWSGPQTAGIGIVLQTPSIQSLSPAYVDTLVFDNQVTRTTSYGGPTCTDGVQAPTYLSSYDSAFSNGSELITGANVLTNGEKNYPLGTILCGNTSSNFGCTYTDWPYPAGASTLDTCQ